MARVLRSTIAYVSGVSESVLTEDTKLAELGIDSVSMFAAGLVLQSELEIEVPESDIVRIFTARTVSESIALLVTCTAEMGRKNALRRRELDAE
jgi:acyl carrier protein